MGCSAVLLSNRLRDYRRIKYTLEHIVRTHKGADNRIFGSVYQEDSEKHKGLKISRDLVEVGGDAIKTNITTLGPLVLPFSEQLLFLSTLAWKTVLGKEGGQLYIPDYKLAFEHFCVHAASKTVLDELQRNLKLSDKNLEASRATLHRFGNTSSSSIWIASGSCRLGRVSSATASSGNGCEGAGGRRAVPGSTASTGIRCRGMGIFRCFGFHLHMLHYSNT
ncbi:hypothetical protein SASPL_127709 [Salvia splendens]|uniref:3-ketoacyl-CoA synthase n=1 Tax=Salvia splendens TaxID=180675 RepID=A0A8X8ZLF1_SALSN|nr:hypothetical protein SASPL_127709 [Salvia splendens]